jgi:hypothetical protein
MTWIDRINQRDSYLGAPDLPDGWSRVAEAMGGLADDDCLGCDPAGLGIRNTLEDHDRVHEAMGGMVAADEL